MIATSVRAGWRPLSFGAGVGCSVGESYTSDSWWWSRNYRKQRKPLSEIEFFGVIGGIVMVAVGVCMIRFADYLLDNIDRLRIALFGTRLVALLPSVRTPRAGGVGFILGGVALSVIATVSAIRGL